jgi:hypothetical protein
VVKAKNFELRIMRRVPTSIRHYSGAGWTGD